MINTQKKAKGGIFMFKKCLAEFIGTAVLVIFGCGVAMTNGFGAGYVGIALAFGLAIVAMAYSIGNVSGCHINPAVSIAVFASGKMSLNDFIAYVVSQFLGAIAGAGVLLAMFGSKVAELGMGTNGFAEASAVKISMGGAFITEVVLTFIFALAICGVTSKEKFGNVAGIVIGLTLTVVHLLGLPITGTSVNPARSFGPALVSYLAGGRGSELAISQVWLFIVAPLIGGVLAAIVYKVLDDEK